MDVIEKTIEITKETQTAQKGLQEAVYMVVDAFLTENKGRPITDLYDQILQKIEPPLLKVVMERNRSNQLQAAKILGVSRGTIRKMLLRYFGTRYFRLTED